MTDLPFAIIFLIAGIGFLFGAIHAKRGGSKFMFMLETNPVAPVDGVYAAIPFGIGAILVSIGAVIADVYITRWLFGIGLGGGIFFGFILMAWKPRWLKPDWLLWLEDRYGASMLEFMFDQARKEGRSWGRRVATQEGLERWAEEMEQKYRSYIGDGYR